MDLASAYREVGLYWDAIREFRKAVEAAGETPSLEVAAAYDLLTQCCLDVSEPEAAADWATKGLAQPGLTAGQEISLLSGLKRAREEKGQEGETSTFCSTIYPETSDSGESTVRVRYRVN
jgi:hypothetical protein